MARTTQASIGEKPRDHIARAGKHALQQGGKSRVNEDGEESFKVAGHSRSNSGSAPASLCRAIHALSHGCSKELEARTRSENSEHAKSLQRARGPEIYAWFATVLPSAACAAASRAIGTRYGEQET